MNKLFRNLAFWLLLLVISVAIAMQLGNTGPAKTPLSYSQLVQNIDSKQVQNLTFTGPKAEGKLVNGTD